MVFSSIIFIHLFLPLLLFSYFLLPNLRTKNLWLLIASLIFYAWGERAYALLMLISISMNYYFAIGIERFRDSRYEKIILILAIVINLGLLGIFKYTSFAIDTVNGLLSYFNWQTISNPKIHLPAGISFYTFQALSYVIDIYRRTSLAQKSFSKVALFIAFFPQLIAGPIITYHDVSSQFDQRKVTSEDLIIGIQRFILGLAKKVLIANTLAAPVDEIFKIPGEQLTLGIAWLGIIGYTLQIYFDFSGYSDMAIGLARMFGFHFIENFNYPYISKSIREFWRRWHISLSNWLRDYLYIPLGGSRCSPIRNYFNLMIVFTLCGLWHGASWNFVIWGLFHGFFLVVERLSFMQWLNRVWFPIRHLYTISVVMLGWVFFRSTNYTEAITFIGALFGQGKGDGISYNSATYFNLEVGLVIGIGIIASTPIFPYIAKIQSYFNLRHLKQNMFKVAFSSVGFALLNGSYFSFLFIAAIARLASGTYNPFIYFRF